MSPGQEKQADKSPFPLIHYCSEQTSAETQLFPLPLWSQDEGHICNSLGGQWRYHLELGIWDKRQKFVFQPRKELQDPSNITDCASLSFENLSNNVLRTQILQAHKLFFPLTTSRRAVKSSRSLWGSNYVRFEPCSALKLKLYSRWFTCAWQFAALTISSSLSHGLCP